MNMTKESYTIQELAALWEVKPKTVWRRIKEGKLKAFRVGRSIRIKACEKARYEENSMTLMASC